MLNKRMENVEKKDEIGGGGIFGSVNISTIFLKNREAFNIGAPHIEKKSFETVRFLMLMKARPNCPLHLIMVITLLSPTREMLLTF